MLVTLHVVSTCFDDAQITHITLQNDLQKYITSHKNPLELYNQNIYSHQTFTTTEEIISDIQKSSYTLTMTDYKILSEIYKIGFCLFTNYYNDSPNKYHFELFIIIDESLYHPFYLKNLQIIPLYQDAEKEYHKKSNLQVIYDTTQAFMPLQKLFQMKGFIRECKHNYPQLFTIFNSINNPEPV